MTKELLLLKKTEFEMLFHSEPLEVFVSHWFLVPENTDERKICFQLRKVLSIVEPRKKELTEFTILPTTSCNARCFYCYEKGRSNCSMDRKTAVLTADYIQKNSKGKKVFIRWFGGEPLCHIDAIDIICRCLSKNNVEYKSCMVSNGYLFGPEMIAKAFSLWHLKSVQITLDGTERIHNQSKAFIYKEGKSPYVKIIKHIESLLHAGIQVTIRLNMGWYNMENLFRLEQKLAEQFQGIAGLKLYSQPLFNTAGNGLTKYSDTQRADIFQKQWDLQKKIDADGFGINVPLRRNFRVYCCMADKGDAVVIAPTGEVGLCEHYSESQFIGHVSNNRKDNKRIESWLEGHLDLEECAFCAYYPECIRLKKCAEWNACYPETRMMKIQQIKRSMLYEYHQLESELYKKSILEEKDEIKT